MGLVGGGSKTFYISYIFYLDLFDSSYNKSKILSVDNFHLFWGVNIYRHREDLQDTSCDFNGP